MSPVDDVGDEGVLDDLLELAHRDVANDKGILVHLDVVFLVTMHVLNVYLLCTAHLCLGLRVTTLEHLNTKSASVLLGELVSGDLKRFEFGLPVVRRALCLVDGDPLSGLEDLQLQQQLVLVHEVVGRQLNLELSIAPVVLGTADLDFPFGLIVTLLAYVPHKGACLDQLPHIALHDPYEGLFLQLRLVVVDVVNMELYAFSLLLVVTQDEGSNEFGVGLVGNDLGSPDLHIDIVAVDNVHLGLEADNHGVDWSEDVVIFKILAGQGDLNVEGRLFVLHCQSQVVHFNNVQVLVGLLDLLGGQLIAPPRLFGVQVGVSRRTTHLELEYGTKTILQSQQGRQQSMKSKQNANVFSTSSCDYFEFPGLPLF